MSLEIYQSKNSDAVVVLEHDNKFYPYYAANLSKNLGDLVSRVIADPTYLDGFIHSTERDYY